jgi:toxin ParE1/3/4
MAKLKFIPQFYEELEKIKHYVALDNIKMAKTVVANILNDLERLETFPESGKSLANLIGRETKYRYIATYDYATLYFVDKDVVIISTIIHFSRDFNALQLDK